MSTWDCILILIGIVIVFASGYAWGAGNAKAEAIKSQTNNALRHITRLPAGVYCRIVDPTLAYVVPMYNFRRHRRSDFFPVISFTPVPEKFSIDDRHRLAVIEEPIEVEGGV